MQDHIENAGRRLAYRQFRTDHPNATHEESITFAARCWREFLAQTTNAWIDDEPERLVAME